MMYLTPYRRQVRYMVPGDRVARHIGHIHSEVHVPLDVKDEKDAFVLTAVVPGLTAEDINIEIVNDSVEISGEFKKEIGEDETYLRCERPSGHFRRALRFSTKLEAEKAEAKLENGILTLQLPKVAEAQPKTIAVKAG